MIEQITALLEKFNVPTNIIDMIKDKVGDNLDINQVVEIVEEHKDKIPDSVPLISSLKSMDLTNLSGSAEDVAKEGLGGLADKAKGMLGM